MTDETGQLVILDCPIDRSADAQGQRDNYDAAFGRRRRGLQSGKERAVVWFGEESGAQFLRVTTWEEICQDGPTALIDLGC